MAFGAIRALNGAGLQVPGDVSVVGFDDIESAAYNNPAITTVRQPLKKMGEIAARTLLNQIENAEPRVSGITIEVRLQRRRIWQGASTTNHSAIRGLLRLPDTEPHDRAPSGEAAL